MAKKNKLRDVKNPGQLVDTEVPTFEVTDLDDVGVPGLFVPGDWDIAEEMQSNEALMEYRREQEPQI